MLCTHQAPKLSFCRLSLDRSLSTLQRSRVQPGICSVPSVQVSRRPLCARLAAQPEYPRCLTPAVALNKHETPNGGIHFHSKHPRPPPKEPTHWPAFTPPRSANRRRSSGWFCHRPAHTQKCSSLIFQTDSKDYVDDDLMRELTFVGLVGMIDPLREGACDTNRRLTRSGYPGNYDHR